MGMAWIQQCGDEIISWMFPNCVVVVVLSDSFHRVGDGDICVFTLSVV